MIYFWVEVSQKIGMGHLMETLALSEYFTKKNIPFKYIINTYNPAKELLLSKKISFKEYEIHQVNKLCELFRNSCVIIDHRNVSTITLKKLRQNNIKVIVIDQLGNKIITSDVLINSTMIKDWLIYTFEDSTPKCCFGAEYAILRKEFKKLHKLKKKFSNKNKTVLVTMGGVDRTGATLRVVEALLMIKEPVKKEIILGKGFVHMEQFLQLVTKIRDPNLIYAQGVNDLGERMQRADIVISAGGNTVYEMACVGTPGLILWEDLHENIQGKAFAEKEVVINVGNGIETSLSLIKESVCDLLNNVKKRKYMSKCGKNLVDDRGVNRIIEVLLQLMKS